MLKPFFITLVILSFFKIASAQKKIDTVVYYLKNDGKVVKSKDSADLFLLILPPDTDVDKALFRVSEYYPDGKMRLLGSSTNNDLNIKFQGSRVTFFPNGHKMNIMNYDNGTPVGDILEFYPNGKFYNKKSVIGGSGEDIELLYKDCSDSTGKVMSENGNGQWIEFLDQSFKNNYMKGNIMNGLKEGIWDGKKDDSLDYAYVYSKNQIISSLSANQQKQHIHIQTNPEYPGGTDALVKFVYKNMIYPSTAISNRTYGTVIVKFIVEKDGTFTDVSIARGVGDGCDEEAIRILKLSQPWKPAYQDGKPISVACSIPIAFILGK